MKIGRITAIISWLKYVRMFLRIQCQPLACHGETAIGVILGKINYGRILRRTEWKIDSNNSVFCWQWWMDAVRGHCPHYTRIIITDWWTSHLFWGNAFLHSLYDGIPAVRTREIRNRVISPTCRYWQTVSPLTMLLNASPILKPARTKRKINCS